MTIIVEPIYPTARTLKSDFSVYDLMTPQTKPESCLRMPTVFSRVVAPISSRLLVLFCDTLSSGIRAPLHPRLAQYPEYTEFRVQQTWPPTPTGTKCEIMGLQKIERAQSVGVPRYQVCLLTPPNRGVRARWSASMTSEKSNCFESLNWIMMLSTRRKLRWMSLFQIVPWFSDLWTYFKEL